MTRGFLATVAGSSLFIFASPAFAQAQAEPGAAAPQQTAAAAGQTAAAEGNGLEEVVVTARRKEENLQDVPETVEAVTAQAAQDYNILEFSDMSKLIAGFSTQENGFANGLTLRGINGGTSNIPNTAVEYLNEAPADPSFMFMSNYDMQDFEVVRGPQGTIRGEIAETGAVTFSTHRPDLEEMGGYASTTVGSLDDTNVQGAVGFPIIPGKLAIRIAGTRDQDEYNYVYSLNNPSPPSDTREAGRISVRLVPTDNFDAFISYQHADRNENYYSGPYYGSGNGVDGPPLVADQNKTVEPGQSHIFFPFNDIEGTFNLTLFGQRLTYVGGYNHYIENIHVDGNPTNADPGVSSIASTTSDRENVSDDIRIASAQPLFGGHLDYVAGFFYNLLSTKVNSNAGDIFLPGAFGNPSIAPPIPGVPLNYTFITAEQYILNPQYQKENAEYANATIHIDPSDDLTGGVRYGLEWHHAYAHIAIGSAYEALPFPAPVCAAHGGQFGVSYPGYCNVPFAAENIVVPGGNDEHLYQPFIYNVEYSHKFNPDLLVYLRTGNSWRYGAINPALAPFTGGDPRFAPYLLPAPEQMTDYEGGVKATFLDKRLTLDIDYYFMDYSSFFYSAPAAWHIQYSGAAQVATYGGLGSFDVPAKVDGIEANAAWNIIPSRWTATGAFALSHGWVTATAPCNPPGIGPTSSPAAALAALQAANVITFTCPGLHDTTLHQPEWNFNIQSQYDQPINANMNAFIRGLVSYYTSNALTGIPGFVQPSYATGDLYLGVHPTNGQWEVAAYAKNVTNNRTVTSANIPATEAGTLGTTFQPNGSGYFDATILPPRELGLTVRYAFGSK